MARSREKSESATLDEPRKGSRIIPILLLVVIAVLFLRQLTAPELKAWQSSIGDWTWTWEWSWSWLWEQINYTLDDIPNFIAAQWKVIWTVFLWSLIPGVAGLFYRRSFGRWFALAFVTLYAINRLAPSLPADTFGSLVGDQVSKLHRPYDYYLAIEGLLILLLLAFRLSWRKWRLVDIVFIFEPIWAGLMLLGRFLGWGSHWVFGKLNSVRGWLFLPLKPIGLAIGLGKKKALSWANLHFEVSA
jgi:hypothetical protein